MKVIFYPDYMESDVYEVPDDTSEEDLNEMAYDWINNNVGGLWKAVEEHD